MKIRSSAIAFISAVIVFILACYFSFAVEAHDDTNDKSALNEALNFCGYSDHRDPNKMMSLIWEIYRASAAHRDSAVFQSHNFKMIPDKVRYCLKETLPEIWTTVE